MKPLIALALSLTLTLPLSPQAFQWRGRGESRGRGQLRAFNPIPGIPAAFSDLFDSQSVALNGWTNYILAQWAASGNGYYTPLLSGNELTTISGLIGISAANTNQAYFDNQVTKQLNAICGQTLVTPSRSIGLGARVVKLNLGFPILYPAYYTFDDGAGHTGPGTPLYTARLSIIQQAVTGARDRGCSVIAQSQVAGAQGASVNDASLDFFYASLAWAQYKTGRATNVVAIANLLAPDWINYSSEPDTEYTKSGQNYPELQTSNANFGTNLISMVTEIRDALNAAGISGLHTTIRTAIGSGSWVPTATYNKFVPLYMAFTGVEAFDIHIHAINAWVTPPTASPVSYLQRIITMTDLAIASGKLVGYDESNIDKSRTTEQGTLDPTITDARSTLSFWSPNEIIFAQGLMGLSHWKHAAYVSLSRPQEMFYSIDFASCSQCTCLPYGAGLPQTCTGTDISNVQGLSNSGQFAAMTPIPPTLTTNGLAVKTLFTAY